MVLTRPGARRRVVVLGGEPEASEAVRFLVNQADREYAVVGTVRAGYGPGGEPVSLLTSQGLLSDLIRLKTADEIVNAAPESDSVATEVVAALHRTHPGITVRNFSSLYEQLTGRVPIRYVCPHWRPLGDARAATPSVAMKRFLDLFVSLAMIVLLSPLFLLVALAIRLDSRGPVIYRQEREGIHGRTFTMLKFRTMIDGAEGGDAMWERHEDPRRTRIGKLLRPLHLDEAPQLLNVLSGTMSLVGPRPERSQFVRQLEKVAPAYRLRMLVRPGITGWAQVRFGYARSLEESFEKLEHDLFYVKHWSPYLDLVIGLKTFAALIRRNGNDAPPELTMLESIGTATVDGEATTAPASASVVP
jgi:exopolysaccharide biosynthesis polyprenyl glycosylphosphotransferase